MKVKVKRLFTDRKTFRTPIESLDGMPEYPSIGKKLFLSSSTFESGGIYTSEVEDVSKDGNVIHVRTKSTVYTITIMED